MRIPLTLLPQLWLALLHQADAHIAHTRVRKSVEMRSKANRLNNEQNLRPTVIRTIHNCTDRKTKCHPKFVARGSSTYTTVRSAWIASPPNTSHHIPRVFRHVESVGVASNSRSLSRSRSKDAGAGATVDVSGDPQLTTSAIPAHSDIRPHPAPGWGTTSAQRSRTTRAERETG
jgi:hypothetical protein